MGTFVLRFDHKLQRCFSFCFRCDAKIEATGHINAHRHTLMSCSISRFGIDAMNGCDGGICVYRLSDEDCVNKCCNWRHNLCVIFDALIKCAVTVPAFECGICYALRAPRSRWSIVQFEFNQLERFGLRSMQQELKRKNWNQLNGRPLFLRKWGNIWDSLRRATTVFWWRFNSETTFCFCKNRWNWN